MQQYVMDAIILAMKQGNCVHNQDLKDLVMRSRGIDPDFNTIPWRILNAPIKDEPMEHGMLYVPDGEYWYLNPDMEHYQGWIRSTLGRHEPEQRRILKTFTIGNYAHYLPEEQRRLVRQAHAIYTEIIARWDDEAESAA